MIRIATLAALCILLGCRTQTETPVPTVVVPQRVPTFEGKVVRVIDGDTVSVLVGQTEQRIRLEGIVRFRLLLRS